jgi:hypothetical protein
MKRKNFSAFVGIKRIFRKIGAHNVLAKSLRPTCFARVVVKFLPRIKGGKVNFLHENRLEKGYTLNIFVLDEIQNLLYIQARL